MICKNCGRPLIKIRDLTESELKNILYLEAREEALLQLSETLLLNPLDKKIKKAYLKVANLIAKNKILKIQLNRDILKDKENFIIDGGIYKHENI